MKKNILKEVTEILFRDWDPIQLNDNENLWDEYATYASKLLIYAREKTIDAKFIEDYLRKVEEDIIGIKSTPRARTKAARNIIAILYRDH